MSTTRMLKTNKSLNNTWLLATVVIFAFIASSVLSVDAIRCHQCNSHITEDCRTLRLNTPGAPVDEQYLSECGNNADYPNAVAFCRKVALKIDVSKEDRIIRSCGWMPEAIVQNISCFDGDNEGYKQKICTCFEDGCNSAPSLRVGSELAILCWCFVSTVLGVRFLQRSF